MHPEKRGQSLSSACGPALSDAESSPSSGTKNVNSLSKQLALLLCFYYN